MITTGSDAKKFIKIAVLLLAGIWLCDFGIGSIMKAMYQRQRSGLLYRTSYAMDSTKAQYVVLGSSRANHDYDPHLFEQKLQASFYNCGRDKQGLLYSCAVLEAILRRYHPKAVIMDIRPDEFTQTDEGTLATLLPYYKNPAVRPYLDYNSRFESIKLFSKIYPYNSLLSNLVVGLKKDWKEDYKGYRPLYTKNPDTALENFSETGKMDGVKLRAFTVLLKKVRAFSIPVFVVISPIHYHCSIPVTSGICRELAARDPGIHYLDFTNDPAYNNNDDYSDNNHLNATGAARYSAALADTLATFLN